MSRFEPDSMVKDVHEITETLCKIRAGKFTTENFKELTIEEHHFKNLNFADGIIHDDYYDDYGMEDYGHEDYEFEIREKYA